ncbi:MAG: 4-(cytidine 5'-diphospho)-2-C-methyl-D-erythritol kinase [Candidatus Saganbacteria bacterium]|nr:4-(cytidine 5'-diphospho)-2-C-methyl-D-erythritol kinase [Candidatus Saganbacteria bacterium]
MKLEAFAKINLSLRVLPLRADGFHSIESVMQSVSLCDYVTVELCSFGIHVTCDDPNVPQGKDNLVYRAVEVFQNTDFVPRSSSDGLSPRERTGVRIHIEKHIPIAAGLAGGSADAAAVLYGLAELASPDTRPSFLELLKLGAEVGSDVPFCLTGGTCLVEGRGEIVDKQEPWPKTYFVLVCPEFSVSTKWAYEEFDKIHLTVSERIKNDLEPAVVSKYEEVTDIKEKLLKLGCSETQMSGSGPSVFGVVRHKLEAEEIFSQIKEDYPRSFLVETVDKGVCCISS